MTEEEKAARALEAERLLRDDTITQALDAMRAAALEQLVQAKPDDTLKITQLQAYVGAVDAFRGQLSVYVTAGTKQKARGGLA